MAMSTILPVTIEQVNKMHQEIQYLKGQLASTQNCLLAERKVIETLREQVQELSTPKEGETAPKLETLELLKSLDLLLCFWITQGYSMVKSAKDHQWWREAGFECNAYVELRSILSAAESEELG